MRKRIASTAIFTAFLLVTISSRAQSLKDLFNKENISKIVNTVTGETATVNLTGTWNYKKPAIEFKSDNLLMKAGGGAAAAIAEGKLDEQLNKIGIKEGEMNFTFQPDSTFTHTVGKRILKGTYSYNAADKQLNLKYLRILPLQAKVDTTPQSMSLLFNSDKLLKLLTLLGSKSSSATLKTISSLAENYDGMMLGFDLQKQ